VLLEIHQLKITLPKRKVTWAAIAKCPSVSGLAVEKNTGGFRGIKVEPRIEALKLGHLVRGTCTDFGQPYFNLSSILKTE
jgi:hypothetical protein